MSKHRQVRQRPRVYRVYQVLAHNGTPRSSRLRPRTQEGQHPHRHRRTGRLTRRRFLAATAGAGALLALPAPVQAQTNLETRTLFFNLAHEGDPTARRFLVVGARRDPANRQISRYPLLRVSDNPSVLAQARQTNAFLRSVPDSQITHYAQNVVFATDISTLAHITKDENTSTGTWSMSMMFQHLPAAAVASSFVRVSAAAASSPLPLSAKRFLYNLPPAVTQQDLSDEHDFIDSTDHARTLIGLHPDILSAEPNSAAYIHNTHISTNSKTRFLAGVLRSKGPALPQAVPGQKNANGWATLTPILQDDGQPYKNSIGLNQYSPDWHSDVDGQVVGGIDAVHKPIKNDPTLGADVTGVAPASVTSLSGSPFAGKLWYRHDGIAGVTHSTAPSALRDTAAPAADLRQLHGQIGLVLGSPTITVQTDGRVHASLGQIQNWFLRFLGVWVQFIGADDQPIPVAQLPADTFPGETQVQSGLSKTNTAFMGLLAPPYTVAGIPVGPGFVAPQFVMPLNAATAKISLAGIGFNGSWDDPEGLTLVGAIMTGVVNWALVLFFMSVGVSTLDASLKLIASVASGVAVELVGALGAVFTFTDKPSPAAILGALGRVIQGILAGIVGKGLTQLAQAILTTMAANELIDSVPLVGQIARVVAAVVGGITFAESMIEVGISPPIYEFDLVLTHSVSLNLKADGDTGFPPLPLGYTLYYQISYLFDSGTTPHKLDPVDVPNPLVASIPVTLPGLPRGGQINVSVGFYARHTSTPAGQNDWCAGYATTGLQDNTKDQLPDLVIRPNKIPITPTTQYLHTSKTGLNATGQHIWTDTPVAPVYRPLSGGQQPGNLSALRSITVRQATTKQPGYVGYSWQAYSRKLNDCQANAPGQLDQAANLNTDRSNAQSGYTSSPCGLQGGATSGLKLTYSLLSSDAGNLYLDTSSLLVRPVQFNPPSFVPPADAQAFGKLNLDSTRLLLHPAGHLVSINNANHKLETLQIPGAATSDDDAKKRFLARAHSGQGGRPGLMTSPAAAAVSPDGTIIVLEDQNGNNRLQAFDLGGNAVPYFKGQNTPYFFSLDATKGATYLDLAIEFTGYLYVLAQEAGGTFRLDIYHPTQTDTQPISTTRGVNASKLTVDFWRSVYTLNYEVLQLPGGAIPDITEPSVSLWMPSVPEVGRPLQPVTQAVAEPKGVLVYDYELMLDGSRSTSADGQPLTYSWNVTGRPAALFQANTAKPRVQFGGVGPYTFELTVTDSRGYRASDQVTVYYKAR